MDIFTEIAFGEDLDSLGRAEPHAFATAFDSVQLHSERRFYNPCVVEPGIDHARAIALVLANIFFLAQLNPSRVSGTGCGRFWQLCRFFRLTEGEREIRRGVNIIDTFATSVITGRRRTLESAAAASGSTAAGGGQAVVAAAEAAGRLGPDLISRFLEDAAAKARAGTAEADEARTGGSDKELRDVVRPLELCINRAAGRSSAFFFVLPVFFC